MANSFQAACPRCGNVFEASNYLQFGTAACPGCGESVRIISHSSARLPAVRVEDAADLMPAIASGAWKGVRPEHAPRPKPAIDPETDYEAYLENAMFEQARTAVTSKGATCQDWDGRRAFSTQVTLQHPKTLAQEALNVTAAAMDGMLILETVAAPLPRPPLTNLRDAVNRLNMCSGGSTFVLRTCGIVARYRLVPRMALETGISSDGVLRALRQINYDRIVANPFLQEEWLRTGLSKPEAIEKACRAPLAASVASVVSLPQLKALAEAAGYQTLVKGDRLYFGSERVTPEASVWLSVAGGVLRGWSIPGSMHETTQSSERWGVLTKLMGRNKNEPLTISRAQLDKLLDRLNEMNGAASLLDYVWDGERVLAMTIFPPTEKRLEVEEFQAIAETLVKRARDAAEKELSLNSVA
ncbi:MAG: zinc ribbon domain-containing protein [Planctomycetes bacterium]|nr:zinc ribbon domain-containing protein [Planctomycetota bacterium]